jgi:hypothetical protein
MEMRSTIESINMILVKAAVTGIVSGSFIYIFFRDNRHFEKAGTRLCNAIKVLGRA